MQNVFLSINHHPRIPPPPSNYPHAKFSRARGLNQGFMVVSLIREDPHPDPSGNFRIGGGSGGLVRNYFFEKKFQFARKCKKIFCNGPLQIGTFYRYLLDNTQYIHACSHTRTPARTEESAWKRPTLLIRRNRHSHT